MPPVAPVIAVPDRLCGLVGEARSAEFRQPSVTVQPERWVAVLGEYAGVLRRVPRELDRWTGRAFALECPQTRRGTVAAFIASQIWGFGANGYGPHRLAQALTYPGLSRILLSARTQLGDGDPVAAFRTLCVANKIPHVGAAFGSKFLYFADPRGKALVFDPILRSWLARYTGLRLRGSRDDREYALWLLLAEQWSKALNVPRDELELIIFTDGLPADSSWRPPDFSPHRRSAAAHVTARAPDAVPEPSSRVILLGCVKGKLAHRAPAKDLYISPLSNARRAYAEASGLPWLILSAKHGLLNPDQPIAPYDLALGHVGAAARRRWGEMVARALHERFGSLTGMTFEVHAGAAYRKAIEPGLHALGAVLEEPLAGLGMGWQLAWYGTNGRSLARPSPPGVPRRRATCAEIRDGLRDLDIAPHRVAARDYPGDLRELEQPGLYSWWVDEPGARLLSNALEHEVKAGRIYAGQTGATKWPSGKAGRMTLAKRIGRNHLNGSIGGSTFRLTLASILARHLKLLTLRPGRLDRPSEERLSDWMRTHLELAVHPFANRDALADLERQVVAQLDPPLNLGGLRATPIRLRLTALRSTSNALQPRARMT